MSPVNHKLTGRSYIRLTFFSPGSLKKRKKSNTREQLLRAGSMIVKPQHSFSWSCCKWPQVVAVSFGWRQIFKELLASPGRLLLSSSAGMSKDGGTFASEISFESLHDIWTSQECMSFSIMACSLQTDRAHLCSTWLYPWILGLRCLS